MINIILKGTLLLFPLIHISWLYNLFSLPKIFFLSLALIFILLLIIINNKIKIKVSKIHIYFYLWILLFLLILFIWLLNSPDLYVSLNGSIDRYYWLYSYIIVFIYILLILFNSNNKDIIQYLKIISIGGFIVALIWIIFYIFWIDYEHRNISTIWQYNVLWIYLIPPLLLSLYFFINNKIKKYLLFSIIILFSIILTKSRIALWISILSLIYIFFIYYGNLKIKYKIIPLLSIGILFIIILWLYSDRLKLNDSNLASIDSRKILYSYSFDIIKESNYNKLFFWNSLESQKILIYKKIKPELYLFEKVWDIPDRAHNIILDWLIEYWILWFIMFIFLTLLIPIYLFILSKNKTFLDKIILLCIITIFIWNLVWFNYPIILIINLIFSIYFIIKYSKLDKNKKYINIKLLFLLFLLIVTFISYSFYKEILLNYKIKNLDNNEYISDILKSNNNYFKINLLLYSLDTNKNELSNKIIDMLYNTNNPLFLEYILSYYLSPNNQDLKKLNYISNKLLNIDKYNITAMLVKSEICYLNKDINCYKEVNDNLIELLPNIIKNDYNTLTRFQLIKKKKFLKYYWIKDFHEYLTNYKINLNNLKQLNIIK